MTCLIRLVKIWLRKCYKNQWLTWASSPSQESCGSEKWGLPPIRPCHGPRNKVLSLKRIGWLYPIFRDKYFHQGLLTAV